MVTPSHLYKSNLNQSNNSNLLPIQNGRAASERNNIYRNGSLLQAKKHSDSEHTTKRISLRDYKSIKLSGLASPLVHNLSSLIFPGKFSRENSKSASSVEKSKKFDSHTEVPRVNLYDHRTSIKVVKDPFPLIKAGPGSQTKVLPPRQTVKRVATSQESVSKGELRNKSSKKNSSRGRVGDESADYSDGGVDLNKRKTIWEKKSTERHAKKTLPSLDKIVLKPQLKSFFSEDYKSFLNQEGKNEIHKEEKKDVFLKMKMEDIKKLYNQQLLLDVPHIKVKSYFNCISSHLMSDALHVQSVFEVSSDFLRKKLAKVEKKSFDTNDVKGEVSKTFNFKPESDYDTNERILFEMKKRITIRGVENFGYDIFLREKFFDIKIKAKNLKLQQEPQTSLENNQVFPLNSSNSRNSSMKDLSIMFAKKRMASQMDIARQPQAHGNQLQSMVFRGSVFNQNKQINEITQFPNAFQERNFSIIRKVSMNTDAFSIRNSLFRKESEKKLRAAEMESARSRPMLYSFNDDVTVDNATYVQDDEFERTRLNSQTLMDLSKIDWSASVVSRNPSRLVTVH